MGLRCHFVEALVREHLYKPIGPDLVTIGRQAVYSTPDEILNLLKSHGIAVKETTSESIEIDHQILNRMQGYVDTPLISDRALFGLLGAPTVRALDHSPYEGADIIHNLNQAVPEELQCCTDFIVDGSTLDNVFDPARVIRNYAEMLRPGGRLMMINMFSNHYYPYVILPPLWYLDYFIINGFSDCRVYICVYPWATEQEEADARAQGREGNAPDVFTIDFNNLLDPDPERLVTPFFAGACITEAFVFAEKGPDSTTDRLPTQQHYRSQAEWADYRANLCRITSSDRPHLVRTLGDIRFYDVKRGHLFMDSDFTPRDPFTEIQRVRRRAGEPTAGRGLNARLKALWRAAWQL